jgi:hypothetical protein
MPAEEGTKKGALGEGLGLFAAGQQRGGVKRLGHGYDQGTHSIPMGLLYEILIESADGTTTIQIEANSKEEALENGQELYPECRLALVNPAPGEQHL